MARMVRDARTRRGPAVAPDMPSVTSVSDEFARFTHAYLREQIIFADQKAAAVFAASTALLAYLSERGTIAQVLNRRGVDWSSPTWIAGALGVAGLATTAVIALAVVVPRLSSTRDDGLLFWRGRSASLTQTAYVSQVMMLTGAEATAQIVRHSHDLSSICRRKFAVLTVALVVSAVAFTATVVHLLLVRPTR
jgi:hypothetical protein